MQGKEQNHWLRKGIPKSGALTIISAYVVVVLVDQRESVSVRSIGADLSVFKVRNKGVFVGSFL